jgi:hypothetical protein
MDNRRNYYRILQVQPGAPVEIIRASYRTLMQRLKAHPDLGGDHGNAALINEAYAVLTDPAKRAEYDRDLQARVAQARTAAGQAPGVFASPSAARCLFCGAVHRSRTAAKVNALCEDCGSPLHPATRKRLAADGKRVINRLPRHHPLALYTAWPQAQAIAGESLDVSLNGIRFVTAEPIAPQAIVKLDSSLCKAVIRVTNASIESDGAAGRWLIGAEFLSVLFLRTRGSLLSTKA